MVNSTQKIGSLVQTLLRPDRLFLSPIHMQYEPSSRCNQNCLHCEHNKNRKYPRDATFDEFKRFYDLLKPLYITLNGYGEPLMCRDLPRIIGYARDKGTQVNTTTNGILLKKYAQQLLDSELNLLNVSLDAAREETYSRIRGLKLFYKIVENIKYFNRLRMEGKASTLLRLSIVVQQSNLNELAEFSELSKELGADSVIFQLVETGFIDYRSHDAVGSMTLEKLKRSLDKTANTLERIQLRSNITWMRQNSEMLWNHHILRNNNTSRRCWKPWHSMYVTVDGTTRPCCNFVTDDVDFGTVRNGGALNKAYNTKKFRAFRKALSNMKRPHKPCKACVPETIPEILFREKF
ncbi:MAG: radical SAM protein [Candidatus Scalindua sp. AMX11]|nr:MAG: radical SAM protein [Candidatus Scalindua sp.]NOG82242.1 radical SAM protein [Planctomycetota bacterium]RZV71466.1 MAG: radical SAM protein [Candidatus Scalindua sp. SCAELEC01]TDE64270.1 MAG: radical SAM protein [Candidatus Scalindua sp. AMX11]GJQ59908.1 MAG: radical SAM protein [Candidatus Scalindua sp.]